MSCGLGGRWHLELQCRDRCPGQPQTGGELHFTPVSVWPRLPWLGGCSKALPHRQRAPSAFQADTACGQFIPIWFCANATLERASCLSLSLSPLHSNRAITAFSAPDSTNWPHLGYFPKVNSAFLFYLKRPIPPPVPTVLLNPPCTQPSKPALTCALANGSNIPQYNKGAL